MDDDWLAARFEAHRPHLCTVAYRILGSVSEAEDAVQEAWLRMSRADTDEVANPGGWFTTIVARVALNMLQSRRARREEPLAVYVPDPVVRAPDGADPEQQALVADSVSLALLVVLDTLAPAERLAFVLHDMFSLPFDEIAAVVGRSPAAARQLASRARRRVQGATVPDADVPRQREVVDAFLAAARDGDFEALLALLDPDVTLRADVGAQPPGASRVICGAAAVAGQALAFAWRAELARPALVNGAAGVLVADGDRPVAVMGFAVARGRIKEIDILADPARLRLLDLPRL
ncbi:RNA polymerase sigma factor SigJ [Microbispora corallina]|uniref:DNA-directed RNA polymerase sigma-70 factor n=1 Tax=Microbispora corallina TaxID=83302 RepID=A0ABQ4G7G2_9ACTN|nr:RNA polymerase sigma factor SigJ [Microbispora corallina]GIH42989.1 DNA-directed RNA polymerase sigma-70 factor [Microbispora corallina]